MLVQAAVHAAEPGEIFTATGDEAVPHRHDAGGITGCHRDSQQPGTHGECHRRVRPDGSSVVSVSSTPFCSRYAERTPVAAYCRPPYAADSRLPSQNENGIAVVDDLPVVKVNGA